MDRELANALVMALNFVKGVYDMAMGDDEEAIRPLMEGAMNVARTLQVPFESENGMIIDEFLVMSAEHLERANRTIKENYREGDAL